MIHKRALVGLLCLAACSQSSGASTSSAGSGGKSSNSHGGAMGGAGGSGGGISSGKASGGATEKGASSASATSSLVGGSQGRGGDSGSGGGGSAGRTGGTSSVGSGGVGGSAASAGRPSTGGSSASGGGPGAADAGVADARSTGGSAGSDAGGFTISANPVAVNGASTVTDGAASGGTSIGLGGNGQGAEATGLPAASRLAIHYASVSVGTISVSVNGGAARKVNVHSSGALTGSFLYAIIDIDIPANGKVTISRANGDAAVNIDKIMVGDGNLGLPPDIWNLSPLKPADGDYKADWKQLGQTYAAPDWWREAKFGAWSHWDPQSMPEQGDWYSRWMYIEGNGVYDNHVKTFGHPSVYGYKDICKNWVLDRWKPDELMALYVEMGAHYFMAMGAHHDNFDCWDSTYQPWNSVKVGPKVDVVATWQKSARQVGLRFGIGFHNSPPRTWGQFMPVRYTSDKQGAKAGVPYDALQTILDGKGKWWEGMDPVDLYGPAHNVDDTVHSPFANQFMWRVDDAITKYHPDMIYFDELAGEGVMDLGVNMGLGYLSPTLIANYYNKSVAWNNGKMDVVINLKGVGGTYNSFKSNPDLLSYVERALVRSTEGNIEPKISAYPFQTETTIQDWHYRTGQGYIDAKTLVQQLMENVSRNGAMLLNLTQHGRGDLDTQVITIAKDIGAWLKVNGEAVYNSRPFENMGDTTVAYTRNNGNVYAALLNWNGGAVTLSALKSGSATLGKVSKVELLGSTAAVTFNQTAQGLTVTPSGSVAALSGISDQQLASKVRVFRITHDKGWVNDDDPGASYVGWLRKCSLGTGDYNDDLTTSSTVGTAWSTSFTGNGAALYAPKESGAGKIEIQVDGQITDTVDLSATGARQPQQLVAEVSGLTSGKHSIRIINRGPGPVAIDALVAR
jgi:alpha-L-fucosidase